MTTDAGQVAPPAGAPDEEDLLEPEELERREVIQGLLQELTAIAEYLAPVRDKERRRIQLFMQLRDEFGVPNTVIAPAAHATPEAVRVAVSKERARVRAAEAERRRQEKAARRAAARAGATPPTP